MRPVRFLFFSLLLAACSASPGEPRATEAAAISANASELTLIECPWGSGQCAWPGAGDRSKALHVGGWTTGTGPTAKVTRTDLLAKFVMQGSGFVSEVRLAASRDGSQSGSLWVELRADDVKPEGGRILARGRTLVSNAPNGTLGELRVPLHTVAPVSRLADGTTYWLRIWVQPTSTKAPAALWLDTASIAPTGMALRSCATTGASWAATCPAYRVTPGALLAFLPALEALASPSCEDRVRNGDEAGRDCGKAACNRGCGVGSRCSLDADCRGGVCRPEGIGLGESDDLCGPDAGDGRLTCSCIAKLDLGGRCGSDVDCLSGVCQGNVGTPTVSPRCVLATCRDGLKNGTETGVDCGGSCEQRCALGTVCGVNADCDKGLLCGGDVKPYTCRAARSEGLACTRDWQCATGACVAKLCRAVGTTNALCDTKPDCDSLVCTNARCAAPKYTDRARNGSETDVDCGGSGTGFKACVAGQKCSVAGDCKAGFTCSGGVCGAALSAACSKPIDCLSGLCGKPTGTTKNVCLEKYPDDDARHCSNKVPDADETDVDCGGAACGPCADKLKCGGENDCQSGVCTTTGQCAPPSCKDGVQNGSETAVDCGGTKCGKCSPGVAAPDAASCASGVRSTDLGVCLDATCFDGLKNGLEKGVDCGGACAPCGTGGTCTTTTAAADCASGVCSAATKTCQGPTASDRVKNGDETDANCGGSSGKGCALKKRCGKDADCVSGAFCANGICAPPMCTNNVLDKSAGEVDIDCGGSCGLCSDGKLCTAATQCASGVCAKATGATAKTCAAPTATDKLKNGDEMGVDCGGPNAPGCGYASPCRDGGDCAGGMVCLGGRCNFGACGNTTKTSGATTCGRLCSALCRDGNPCRGSVDCGGEGECVEGQDGQPKCVTRKCVIDGVNYKPGEQSLSDPCRVCDPEAAPVADGDVGAFVVRNDGDVCDDHDPATWGDRCRATTGSLACSGTAFTCTVADGEVCVAKNDPVPDGQRCEEDVDCDVRGATGAKTCVNGRCEGAQCKASLYGNTHACGSTGDCVSGGRCDGVSRTCPTSRLLVDVECRAASGACDEPERCDGVNAACPTTDATKNAGDECLAGTKGGHCRSDSGALACVPCALNEKWNGSACEACPSGSTSPGGAATACQAISCAMNKYWPGRGTTCVACPAGSTSPGGAVSECTLCSTSQWWDGRKCVECPVGHVSDGGTSGFCVVSPCTLEGGSALDFGQVAQTYTARRDYTVSNSGSQDCVLSSGAFVSSGAAVAFGVALAPPPSTVVSPGQTEKLTLTYTPADAVGPDQGELSIRYRANDQGAAENILRVQLTGTPTDRPSCVLLTYPGPSAPLGNNRVLNFGQVKKGTEKELPVTFQNAGSLPCTINGATVSAGTLAGLGGPNDAPFFRIKSPPASVLQPGDSTSIVVGFSPDASRAYGGDFGYLLGGALGGFGLSLEVNTSDTVSFNGSTCGGSILGGGGSPGCVAWALSGQGVSSELSVLPGDVDFGKVTLSCNSRRQKVTLYNTGLVPMTLKSFKVDPAVQPPVFKVIGPATPYMLAGGGQVAFEFVFRPSVGGVHAASLLIESDATNVSSANPYVAVGLKGDGTTETHATDRFDQNIKPKTDVLFVVDNSGSMGEEQKLLGDNAQRFLDTASQLNSDFHVAVVTTDMTEPSQSGHFQTRGGAPKVVVNGPTASANLKSTVGGLGTNGSPSEQGLAAMVAALSVPLVKDPQTNDGFLRTDAKLAVVIVSDEEDQSANGTDFYVDFLENIKGQYNSALVSLSAIVGDSGGGCSSANGQADPGQRYIDVANRTGGKVRSICSSEWGQIASDLGLDAFASRAGFPLSRLAAPSTIQVTVNGQVSPAGNWSYDANANAVVFAAGRIPAAGATVVIDYETLCL